MYNRIKTYVLRFYNILRPFVKKAKEDSLSAYAAQTTFFIILSIFPFLLLMFMFSSNVSFLWNRLLKYILDAVPENLDKYVFYIVDDLVYSGRKSFTIITVFLALWSSAKSIQALSYGLDKIYEVKREKNYIITRLFSIIYTFVFLVLCFLVMLVDIFSDQIIKKLVENNTYISEGALFIISFRYVLAFGVLFSFIILIYYKLPARKGRLKEETIGAVFAATSWIVMTKILSFYIKYISDMSYMYGGLTSIIVIIIWLYIGIQIILYGAVLNYYINHS